MTRIGLVGCFLAVVALLSCQGAPPAVTDSSAKEPQGEASTQAPDTGDDEKPVEPPASPSSTLTDRALFDEVLLGRVDAREGLLTIAARGGWPLAVDEGYLFARIDDGKGPYALAGAHTDWAQVPMQEDGGVYWVISAVNEPDYSLYKFVDGSGSFAADPLSRRFGYDEYGEHSLVAASGAHLERWFGLGADGVAPRTVRVWVPAGPITHHLYVHDGQNLFDPGAPWGGWQLHQASGPGTLIVGIDNTPARMDEYTHVQDFIDDAWVGGDGDAYAAFVEEVVQPFIESTYGVPTKRGVLGSSLGGLIAYYQALLYPGNYDFVGSMSGTFGWGSIGADNETLIERYGALPCQPSVFYLDSGGGPKDADCVDSDGDGVDDDDVQASDNYCENRQMADTLAAAGCIWNESLFHWYEPGALHNEAAWRDRAFRPLSIFEAL